MTRETVRRRRGHSASASTSAEGGSTSQRGASSSSVAASPYRSSSATARNTSVTEQNKSESENKNEKEIKTVEQIIGEEDKSFSQFLSLCAIVTFIFFYMIKSTELPPKRRVYAAVIDAGSTGTRAQIFQFIHNSSENRFMLVDTKLHSIKKSIATLGTGVSGSGSHFFKPLLENIKKNVPGMRRRKRTPIILGATAGLRLLGQDASELALKHSRKALNTTEFLFQDQYVSILDEKDEALYGWTTVNFLLGNIGSGNTNKKQKPVATLELGGASMQMVYSPEVSDSSKPSHSVTLLSEKYQVKPSSYLNLGLHSLIKQLMNLFEAEGILEDENPCYRRGKTFTNKELKLGVEGSEERKKVTITGDGDFERCAASIKIAIDHTLDESKQVDILPKDTVVYAFAYFYDKVVGFGLPKAPTKQQLWDKGLELCETEEQAFTSQSNTGGSSSSSDEACMEFAYVYSIIKMVTSDFSKEKNIQVHFEQYIDNHMIGWALGAALNVIEPIMHHQISLDNEPLTLA